MCACDKNTIQYIRPLMYVCDQQEVSEDTECNEYPEPQKMVDHAGSPQLRQWSGNISPSVFNLLCGAYLNTHAAVSRGVQGQGRGTMEVPGLQLLQVGQVQQVWALKWQGTGACPRWRQRHQRAGGQRGLAGWAELQS